VLIENNEQKGALIMATPTSTASLQTEAAASVAAAVKLQPGSTSQRNLYVRASALSTTAVLSKANTFAHAQVTSAVAAIVAGDKAVEGSNRQLVAYLKAAAYGSAVADSNLTAAVDAIGAAVDGSAAQVALAYAAAARGDYRRYELAP
jgi:hypothetical protein